MLCICHLLHTSIYDLVPLYVCHFHYYQGTFLSNHGLSRYCIQEFLFGGRWIRPKIGQYLQFYETNLKICKPTCSYSIFTMYAVVRYWRVHTYIVGAFCKSAVGNGGGVKSNEEALWFRHEHLKSNFSVRLKWQIWFKFHMWLDFSGYANEILVQSVTVCI